MRLVKKIFPQLLMCSIWTAWAIKVGCQLKKVRTAHKRLVYDHALQTRARGGTAPTSELEDHEPAKGPEISL